MNEIRPIKKEIITLLDINEYKKDLFLSSKKHNLKSIKNTQLPLHL